MKTGKTLTELAAELERQAATRKDFVAPTSKLFAVGEPGRLGVDIPGEGLMGLTEHAHKQVAGALGIYTPYYDRMRTEAPALWAENVNHWFRAEPAAKLIRTLDHRIRGFMSDGYRPLDNFELTAALIPAFKSLGDVKVESCEITESKLYIKAVRPSLQWDAAMLKREAMIKAGLGTHSERPDPDVLQAALTIRNSEVGASSLAIEDGIFRLGCYNLLTVAVAYRKTHVGRKHRNGGGDDDVFALLSDEARQADDHAFWLRVRDVVKHSFSAEKFQLTAERFAGAVSDKITGSVEKVVEVAAVKFGLTDSTRQGMLRHLIEGGDLSRFGLINAATRQSQDEENYDVATDMERLGGKILDLNQTEWRQLTSVN